MTVADFYGRKSSKDDGRSIAGQEDDWRADCAANDLRPGLVFADANRSASRYARRPRPDYGSLLDHIRSGSCHTLALWESSRGSRNLGDWVAFLELCREKGTLIRIITHDRTYDVRRRRDWRTLAEEGIDSADESEKTSERVRRGKRKAALEGRPTSRLAFGWKRIYNERGELIDQVEMPGEGDVVREIIKGVAGRQSQGAIARALNARGITTPEGKQWTAGHVHAIARRASYAGLRVHQGKIVGPGSWQPLIDPAIWHKAQHVLDEPGRRTVEDSRLKNWLTGVIACGMDNCTGRLSRAVGRGYPLYACRGCYRINVAAHIIEGFLEPLILARLAAADGAALFLPATDDAAVAAARAELDQLETRLADFRAEGAKADGLSAAAVAQAERGLIPKIEVLQATIRRLTLPPALADLEGVDIVAEWHTFGPHVRREIVMALAELVIGPSTRRGRYAFDRTRLARSRWTGDQRTWGDIWAAEGLQADDVSV